MNEYAFLGITHDEWMGCVWDHKLAEERGLGLIKTDFEIVERICAKLPFAVSAADRERIRLARNERLKLAEIIHNSNEKAVRIGRTAFSF